MRRLGRVIIRNFIAGALILVPVYLTVLLLLKVMKSLSELISPIAALLPKWFPGENLLAFLLIVIVCCLVGLSVRTRTGRGTWERLEKALFQRIPGYDLFRSLTHRVAGEVEEKAWKPALAEIEEALVPAFIIEELDDGRFTVFVPSVPTPLAGTVYILTPDRVHPVDISFTHAIGTVSRWGSGSKDLVAAMDALVLRTAS
jgi:uncharacterized membrane protein